ncbi:1-deoxy-D-xylulose-5-phosphate synthase [Selenomonas sp. TAMA-11512]|uniref:1-deoxy-D-xylulose-5-phosphate synthase n=1 Tax=Selenomonas sp. TAMA-11512 TaxID=3095337 RepID=UPI00308658E2|nr:1-deoxy-D-xylulose-5-phosphate synthase [Selenomonas sp. TAMA-11512]
MGTLLETIKNPQDFKEFSMEQLLQLAGEIRTQIIETVSLTGGHLAPSLGVVELTIALHRILECPQDKLIWDVGHQSYPHKLLTGRLDRFFTLRQKDGITGFPNRKESPYDAFGTGHASTSISAALGMAAARDLAGADYKVVAIIGDGALTGGEAFEALNQAGALKKNIIVILNDNGMSIAHNVGAMSEYLSLFRADRRYAQAKKELKGILKRIPRIGEQVVETAEHFKDGVRSALIPGEFFTQLGFQYFGPFDGHNLPLLLDILEAAVERQGPILLHVKTHKGHGYPPAEDSPEKFHGIGKFDIENGETSKNINRTPTYTEVFGRAILEAAEHDSRIVAITAAMPEGTGLKPFSERFPSRFYDVGIAEEHAMTFAAGLAASGARPVVALYSTFAQRAYDQIIHDVALQNLPVLIALDRAGFVGADGATHHGVFDYSYLRHIPNLTVWAPKDENELGKMVQTALRTNGPVAIRYPRGEGRGVALESRFEPFSEIRAEVLQQGQEVAILAVGSMVEKAEDIANRLTAAQIRPTIVNIRSIKPLDIDCLKELIGAPSLRLLVTMEENVLAGGFGSLVLETLADLKQTIPTLRFGIPDTFVEQGSVKEELEMCGLLPEQMADIILERLQELKG